MQEGKWFEAEAAFREVLDSMNGHDPLGLIEDSMAYCREMGEKQIAEIAAFQTILSALPNRN